MVANPYQAPSSAASGGGQWRRRLRRWSHGQPFAIFYLILLAIGLFVAVILPVLQRFRDVE
jgi:hypothetical protein